MTIDLAQDDTALVRIERHGEGGHVAELVLDRPEAMNAVSTAMALAIGAATRELADDIDVRAVVLTSSHHRAFCVGADLKERNGFTDAQLVQQRPIARAAYGGVLALGGGSLPGSRPARHPSGGNSRIPGTPRAARSRRSAWLCGRASWNTSGRG